ncbi:MAG: hypothetical protein KIT84_28545 [Labilithrix sp.]|nr:hypothetical protein [Labilithrix sp.]MCW5815009.1 hypothetical protein [Labilithrix sp.]
MPSRRLSFGFVGLIALASCFHGAAPVATISPRGADALSARTQGPFAVVHAAPKGHVADRKQPGVTVMFSRGVRSVDTADDQSLPAITIKTRTGGLVKGTWRWTGTRGLLFSPDGELPGGNDYVVTVPPDVRALDGSVLGKPYVLELSTDGPQMTHYWVSGAAGVTERSLPTDPAFHVQFDQEVDPAAVAAATTLHVFEKDGDKGTTMKVVATRDPDHAKVTPPIPDGWLVRLKPEKPLPPNHQIELTIAESLRGTGGPRTMEGPITRTMRTHGPLRFVDFYCPRLEAKGRCRQGGDVKVILSNPVAPAELKAHLKTDKLPPRPPPKPGQKAPIRKIDTSTEHWLGVAPKLGEKYKVTLTAGMKDVFGQKLEKDASFDLVVEAPLVAPPAPAPAAPEEEKAATPKKPPAPVADLRPRRERLPYRLDVGLSGQVLEANVPGGHKIPVGAINVPTYSSLAAPLTEAQATSWTLSRGSTTEFLSRNGFASTWISNRAPQNERVVDFLDLDAVLAPKKGRGPALLVVSPPGVVSTNGSGRTESFVTVTDLGVSAKMSAFGSLVWVTSLATGKPIKGASVTVRTTKGGDVYSGTADDGGLVVVPTDRFDPMKNEGGGPAPSPYDDDGDDRVRADAALVVRHGDDWTIHKIGRSSVESRLTSDFASLSKEGRWAGMVFADRGVFRPGETAKVAGIVRVVDGDALRSVAGRELRIELKDHNGEQIFDGRAKCDDFGTFAVDMPIPKNAEVGLAEVSATALPGGKSNTKQAAVFSSPIRILEFKPNEFKVLSEADKPFYVRGDEATFTTQGDYLYGAPMQGADVVTTVTRQEVPFTPPGAEAFTVSDDLFTGDYADETRSAAEVESEDGKLDAKGGFSRKVKLAFDDQRRPERIVFEAEVADLSRATVTARSTVLVHPGEFYVGIKSPPDRFVAAGAQMRADVAAIEPTGSRRANVKVKVELVERRWSSVTGEQPDGRPARSSKPVDTVVGSCDALTTTTTGTCNVQVPHAGFFIVRATASDPRGNAVRASTSVYGTETTTAAQTAWAADDRHGIKLEANKPRYDVGDTAKILLRSPFKDGNALVTVERNGVLFHKVIAISGPVPVVEVPIAPSFYPNAFVSVVALRGRVQAPPPRGADLGGPDYRYGWTELVVNEEAHRLTVGVKADKAEYQPGSMVEADVEVKDKSGKPVETALTFYVVDEGVLALTSYQTPDPLPAFVQRRKLGVFTFDNRESLAHILAMKAGERVASLGYEYALARNPGDAFDKGDDGGDGADGLKRADFRTTAYFESGKKTDKSGKAHFSFKLPDNLTTFRLMAVAAAADDRFGSGDSKLSTFRKLMARPALPRLLRVGDQVEASVVVSSKPDEKSQDRSPIPVNVAIDVRGLTLTGPKTKSITMPRGGQMEVRFPVKATDPGEAIVTFDVASSAGDRDRVELKRKVELPVSIESTGVYGEGSRDASIALGDLTQMRKDFGGLDVRVSSSALAGLGLVVDRLNDYPYDCTEQLTSRVLPLVAAFDLAKDAGAKMPPDVNAHIDATIESILKRQSYEGGFGFWDKTTSEPWLSAYAMLAIGGATERKRFVPRDVLERGHDYLNGVLAASTRRLAKPPPSEDDAKKPDADAGAAAAERAAEKALKEETERVLDFVNAAMVADTLASLGWPNPGALNVLYDARFGQRLSGLASLLHAMTKSNMPPAQIKALRSEIEQRIRVGANTAEVDEPESDRWEPVLDSHVRTQALVLRAFVAADPKDPLAARLARRLLALRQQDGAWRTTQEDAWALMALADYRRAQETSGPGLDVRTLLGGTEMMRTKIPRGSFREDKLFISADTLVAKGPTLSFDVKEGRFFYSAQLKYATAALPTKPVDEGLFVAKYVRGVAPSAVKEAMSSIPKKTATEITAGDLVVVDLVFETAEPRDRIVIADPLPAGLEALDYDLDTTSRHDTSIPEDPTKPRPTFLGTTFRYADSRRQIHDDRVDTFFAHVDPGMYHVRYLARATAIGSFVVPPTRIEAMYAPEVYGRTAATALAVRAKP